MDAGPGRCAGHADAAGQGVNDCDLLGTQVRYQT
jgi:hypothetical protein